MASANKTQITEISVDSFIAGVENGARRREAIILVDLITEITQTSAKMWGPSIIGFGEIHYKYESGREGDMPAIAFSPRKPQLVFYGLDPNSLSQATATQLGKHRAGKGCLYIKKLTDIDLEILAGIIKHAWHNAFARQG